MAYKCPLCLKQLTAKDKLIRYCYQCDTAKLITAQPESIAQNSRCSKNNCKSNNKIEQGIYFAHKGCKKANPFWNGSALNVPENTRLDGIEITLPSEKGESKFKHWQINLLSRMIESKARIEMPTQNKQPNKIILSKMYSVKDVKEMWFPGLLLRATYEKRPDKNKRFGQIVALIGSRNAGKTILALQALDNEGYVSYAENEQIRLQDYIYSNRREAIGIQPIFEILRLRSLMKENRPFYQPPPTTRFNANLYASFFTPTSKAFQTNESLGKSPSENLLNRIVNWIKWAFGTTETTEIPFLFTLALYDVAGEDVQKEVVQIEEVKNSADKIALVVDMTDLLVSKIKANDNLADHLRALRHLKDETEKPFCVILTKVDLFFAQCNLNAKSADTNLLKQTYFIGNQVAAKSLLESWKQHVLTLTTETEPLNLYGFLDELLSLDSGNPIFMVETKNLSDTEQEEIKNQPVSKGLDTFVCWALEIERDEIITTK
jgi:GTPase SAR1 family protein